MKKEDIASLVQKQRAFFNTNQTKSVEFRKEQLKKLKRALEAHEQEMHEAIAKDFSKSAFDNYTTELVLIYGEIDDALRGVSKWAARKRVPTNLANFPASSYIIPEPLGVSLVIGAWNYPYQLSFAPVVAAMAAGCTAILKPSELPAHTSAVMHKIVSSTFSPDYFAVVEGGVEETTALLEQTFDKIFFTGSVPVGRIVYQAAAKNLTSVTLELGGKSPAFITPSCNLKMTAKRLVWAKFINAGQVCIAPDYVMVHESIKENFLQAIIDEIELAQLDVSNGNYVQIINERNLERLAALIDPHKVFYGGKVDRTNRIIHPTIMHNVNWSDAVMQQEIFGPILPVITYSNFDQAIAQVKEHPKPLSCYVFTHNAEEKHRILHELSFGGGCVNDAIMHISNPHLPFGGTGSSGLGAYHGEPGFRQFSHYKSILDKPTWLEFNFKYFPHTKFKLELIKRVLRMK